MGDIHQAMPDVTLGAVSLQLKTLVDAGLVESRAERQHRFYRVCRRAGRARGGNARANVG